MVVYGWCAIQEFAPGALFPQGSAPPLYVTFPGVCTILHSNAVRIYNKD
jgi:hypothetical protein